MYTSPTLEIHTKMKFLELESVPNEIFTITFFKIGHQW